eukprot:9475936-Pyramimonas_sp.AAC.3
MPSLAQGNPVACCESFPSLNRVWGHQDHEGDDDELDEKLADLHTAWALKPATLGCVELTYG